MLSAEGEMGTSVVVNRIGGQDIINQPFPGMQNTLSVMIRLCRMVSFVDPMLKPTKIDKA